jgi:hypothetical protein
MTPRTVTLNLVIAFCLVASAAVHAHLYLHGYRDIPVLGPGFLLQASIFGSVGVLIAVGAPRWLRLAALLASLGALGAFALSRTIGLFGFVEHGLQPAPYALVSVVTELLAVVLAAASLSPSASARAVPSIG